MKKFALALVLLAACGSSHEETTQPLAPLDTTSEVQAAAKITTASSAKNTNATDTDAYGNYISVDWYPSDAPALRSNLYSCSSLTSGAIKFKAYVQVFTDKTRLYNVTVTLKDGLTESFVARESAANAAPYSPIKMEAGKQQSSNVLWGITEQTKAAYGLASDANWQINLRSSQQKGNIEMFLTTTSGNVSIPYGSCYRVGQ